jgi:hypothetical protein
VAYVVRLTVNLFTEPKAKRLLISVPLIDVAERSTNSRNEEEVAGTLDVVRSATVNRPPAGMHQTHLNLLDQAHVII